MAFWIALGIAAFLAILIPFCVAMSRGYWHSTSRRSSAWTHAWLAVAWMVMFMVFSSIWTLGYSDPRNYNAAGRVDLQALASNSSYEGRFFLASGTVEEEMVYRYLTKDADGLIERHEVDADRAYIIEEGEDAYLEYRWNCNTWTYPWGACQRPAYVFHVPTGSVLNEYEVTP